MKRGSEEQYIFCVGFFFMDGLQACLRNDNRPMRADSRATKADSRLVRVNFTPERAN